MISPKQKRFCEEYIKDLNGKEAAIRSGYSKNTATQIASSYLNKPAIVEYLEKLQSKTAKRNQITLDELIQDLAEIKNINIADLYDENGSLKDLHQLPGEFTKCIQEITQIKSNWGKGGENEKQTTKVKFYSRLDAIEKLAKHLGFYEKDNSQSKPEVKFVMNVPDQETANEIKKLHEPD